MPNESATHCTSPPFGDDVCVIGGGGHVGLPLAITFANCGLSTCIYDIDASKLARIAAGEMPFSEEGGETALQDALASGRLRVSESAAILRDSRFLVLVIGTPVDEHLNPGFTAIHRAIDRCAPHLRDGQILILRSTVFPGISAHIQRYLQAKGLRISVAYCPERVAQGQSIREFRQLPQIISAFDPATLTAVRELFLRVAPECVDMHPMEAELCKLMTNAWRYIQFATVNQFYMIATQHGLDFDRILYGCRHNYPRMHGMPGPGFAAGPCLMKDTMQLAAFSMNTFSLGNAAMLINEGLPAHLVALAKQCVKLTNVTTGILGMSFKADSDDTRDSLAFKLRKLLLLESRKVVCTDPFVEDASFVPLQSALDEADVLFVATPHSCYRQLQIPEGKLVIDVWNCLPSAAKKTSHS